MPDRLSSVSTQPLSSSAHLAAQSRTPLPQCPKCHGNILSQFRSHGLLFAEVVHPAEQDVPRHTHHTSFYHLTLAGKYDESTSRGRVCFAPFSSAFTHSDTKHDGRIAPGGVYLFTLELGPNWICEFLQVHGEPETVQDCAGGKLTYLGMQLYRVYKEGKAASALTIDALVWELLAAAAALEVDKMGTPPWWGRIIELLHFEFGRDLRISDLAQEAGVHPVYLARVFRRLTKQTPGEWLQRRRIRSACEKLLDPDQGIAAIAAESGFADQSHMTRTFKRYTAMTPAEFRHTLGSPATIQNRRKRDLQLATNQAYARL
jgi:AraC family transcriptional regulator